MELLKETGGTWRNLRLDNINVVLACSDFQADVYPEVMLLDIFWVLH